MPRCSTPLQASPLAVALGFLGLVWVVGGLGHSAKESCDRSRQVLTSSWGILTDGPEEYPNTSHCQWLIKASKPNQFITLNITSIETECSYDHIYVYDGDTFEAPLMASFSGKTLPPLTTAKSGAMLILLYSDTNYVLEGFTAEYSITDCPLNCSSHGTCENHVCYCEDEFEGESCEKESCPDDCGEALGRGICYRPESSGSTKQSSYCICDKGFAGDGCSLGIEDKVSAWHWLYRSGRDFTPRTSHGSVFIPQQDRLYIFGGYDLKSIKGDFLMFDFAANLWMNISDPESPQEFENKLNLQRKVKTSNSYSSSSLRRNPIFTVNHNNTVSVKFNKSQMDQPLPARRRRMIDWVTGNLADVPCGMSCAHLGSSSFNQDSGKTEQRSPTRSHRKRRMIRPSEELNHTPAAQHLPVHQPSPRYGHAMERYDQHVALFGGKLESGEVSSELWLYNTTTSEWRLIESENDNENPSQNPPGLMWASLTLVDETWLYLFGGSLNHGEFTSSLYRINLSADRKWQKVEVRGGNELQARVVGHSTVFHPESRSLLVYGGIMVDIARFSKLSDNLLVFDVDEQYWSEIKYPRGLRTQTNAHIPLERAFHTAVIAGNYMVIFGGYMHKHKLEEACFDHKLYLYHLGCHVWLSQELVPTSEGSAGSYPKVQGVYGHSVALRRGNMLVVIGGFHGTVNNHVLAYILPSTLVASHGQTLNVDEACRQHSSQVSCVSNLECGWCSTNNSCYKRTRGAKCTTNLQTGSCPGLCPSLHSCHSCLIHGKISKKIEEGSDDKSSGMLCSWCVQTSQCHNLSEGRGRCGSPGETMTGQEGWWGPEGTDLTNVRQCRTLDHRPGITVVKYRHPVNSSHPDEVSIVNQTQEKLLDAQEFASYKERHINGSTMLQFLGYIRPNDIFKLGKKVFLFLDATHVNATLWLSSDDTFDNLKFLGNGTGSYEVNALGNAHPGSRFLTRLVATKSLQHNGNLRGSASLLWNTKVQSRSHITMEHLEPYSKGDCESQSNCMACLRDSKCGWCPILNTCILREDSLKLCMQSESDNDVDHFLTLDPKQCMTCNQYIYCDHCISSGECEWLPEESYCARKGRFQDAVREEGKCPTPCHRRKTCLSCLGDPGRCAWCEETQECFLFSVYTSVYQYGSCRAWLDEDHTNVTFLATLAANAQKSMSSSSTGSSLECLVCERHKTCSACLESLGCGWCHNVFNPSIGVCTAGDFSAPSKGECEALVEPFLIAAIENGTQVVQANDTESKWAYASCPDIDECLLSLDNCHSNATCTNTDGSYNCTCQRGFKGDGRKKCDRTCYEDCVHGYCSGSPDYECICTLGWTGDDCSQNCGCYNHSTCQKGIGTCDQCRHLTDGDFCHLCRNKSFGNATTIGCELCDCNDHWDEEKGFCDKTSGQCFCVDNTYGHNCEKCLPGFYGDPRNGGHCYRECGARNIIYRATQGHLGAQTTGQDSASCMWIITPREKLEPYPKYQYESYIIQLTIEKTNINCDNGIIQVFDGLPPSVSDDSIWNRQKHFIGAFCGDWASYPVTVKATTGFMTIIYEKQEASQGFSANYTVMQCPDRLSEKMVCVNGKPRCMDGWTGALCNIPICPKKCSEKEGRGKCDTLYGRCNCTADFVGQDCSVVRQGHQVVVVELFSPMKIATSLNHLETVLPRMGHSIIVDNRGSLWIFGGYSLSRGPLNDVQQFDIRNKTWKQVTVNVQPGLQPPPHRYFHAAAYVTGHREMYIFGGLNSSTFLRDFWKFNTLSESWTRLPHTDLPPLAGHTLTYRSDSQYSSLVLIGGASSMYGFLDTVWEFNLLDNVWVKVNTSGTIPTGIYGHSTVYHQTTQSFYVYGGYSFKIDKVDHFPELYVLDFVRKRWSLLPPDLDINQNPASLPAPRMFHASVTMEDYMVIIGGHIIDRRDSKQGLLVYSYKCNMWIPLDNRFVTVVGPDIGSLIGLTAAVHDSVIYVFGGYAGTMHGMMMEVRIPPDLCTLNSNQTQCQDRIGCASCIVQERSGTDTSYCYSNLGPEPQSCSRTSFAKTSAKGVKCDEKVLESRNCYKHNSCTECLAEWPSHPDSKQYCQWCSNCPKGKCIPHGNSCSKENECEQQTSDQRRDKSVTKVDFCNERKCVASDCDKCRSLHQCVWTRQVLRSSEQGYTLQLTPIYNWNCVEDGHSSYLVEFSPPGQCPIRCHHHTTCQQCLSADGAEGGWQKCYWSLALQECISPSYINLRCMGGVCGQILVKGKDQCPSQCGDHTQCSHCLQYSKCGWCALETEIGGRGICTQGRLTGPYVGSCQGKDYSAFQANVIKMSRAVTPNIFVFMSPDEQKHGDLSLSWHFKDCPPENECSNGHHDCDKKSQVCVDTEVGFKCECADGYNMTDTEQCTPICNQGCVFGTCIEPNKCKCHFGYVGKDCSIECHCNGHSNCEGPDKLNSCKECHNNTMGEQCQKCKPFFVGDPKNNGKCVSCFDFCNTHAEYCVDESLNLTISDLKDLRDAVIEGAHTDAICLGCKNNTTGSKCDKCLDGFFRGSPDTRIPCRPCQCNGHGTECDPVTGDHCNCSNNTDTLCSSSKVRGGSSGGGVSVDKEDDKDCWKQQCSKCEENYVGKPSNGHQCYRLMGVDKEYCLDPYTQRKCDRPSPLGYGQTVYFAVQPKFMNVNIRLVLDVTKGGADVYFSSCEDTFVVNTNKTTWHHVVEIDPKFMTRSQDYMNTATAPLHTEPLKRPLVSSSELETLVSFEGPVSADQHKRQQQHKQPQQQQQIQNKTQRAKPEYWLIEKVASGLKTFVTVSNQNDILLVRNVTNRLVITLPQTQHDLRSAKFYIIVYGIGDASSPDTFGSIFFGQDQARIDLFVFFSVFFSCFFLFLAVCVVIWKVKQGVDMRRARRRQVVEMLHMAKRPFSATTLLLHSDDPGDSGRYDVPQQELAVWSPSRRKRMLGVGKKERLGDGFDVAPVAIEPTDDGVAAVVTVVVQLPGSGVGTSAPGPPHRLALASSLCLMARIYPPAARPFHLRRRTSHFSP
ncbi:multiple EGF like domains 8 [Oratosquilla oratoria]|uniref:multiple EGF like domains 8 n=1 Tax=Oratosquilla oratoria TaxID=337810 RepID=UPI003F76F97C